MGGRRGEGGGGREEEEGGGDIARFWRTSEFGLAAHILHACHMCVACVHYKCQTCHIGQPSVSFLHYFTDALGRRWGCF